MPPSEELFGGGSDSGRVSVVAWARSQAAQATLQRVLEAFNTVGVRALPVKGIVTARLLYEDPSERPIQDIDVRVAPRDLRRLIALARTHGWEVHLDSPHLHEAVFRVDGWEIDVECAVGRPGLCGIPIERLIERAVRTHHPFPHLEPEFYDHVLILVLNAFKDGLEPMPWSVEDLRRLARRDQFEPSALVSRAREGRVLSALWIVADWLCKQKGAAEWRAVRDLVGPRGPSARVARVYRYLLVSGWPSRRGILAVAMSNDGSVRAATGLALAVAGLVRRRWSMVTAR